MSANIKTQAAVIACERERQELVARRLLLADLVEQVSDIANSRRTSRKNLKSATRLACVAVKVAAAFIGDCENKIDLLSFSVDELQIELGNSHAARFRQYSEIVALRKYINGTGPLP